MHLHLGNLRLLVLKEKFSELRVALASSLSMVKFANDSSTFQIMSQDLFVTLEDGMISIARPIIGYMPRSDIYMTQDKFESDFQSIEFDLLDRAWQHLMSSNNIGAHLRISNDKFYFESPMLN